MNKILIILLVILHFGVSAQGSNEIIANFEKESQKNLSFQNGINSFITTPKDDHDALAKGFETMQTDLESHGGWTLIAAQNITVDGQDYRAILYNYQNKDHIALHYKADRNKYYFRIFNSTYYGQDD